MYPYCRCLATTAAALFLLVFIETFGNLGPLKIITSYAKQYLVKLINIFAGASNIVVTALTWRGVQALSHHYICLEGQLNPGHDQMPSKLRLGLGATWLQVAKNNSI